jgi:hypothetical protein
MNAISISCLPGLLAAALAGLVSSGCGAAASPGDERTDLDLTAGSKNTHMTSVTGAAGSQAVSTAPSLIAPMGNETPNSLDANCPCSRRPGANNSFKCAMGTGQSITQRVGAAGGSVHLTAQQGASSGVDFQIDIPPTTLQVEVQVEVTETTNPPPAAFVDYSPIYLVEPREVSSQFPIHLTLPFGGNDGEIPGTLAIYAAADPAGPFERVSDSYINAGFLQGSIPHFGAFFAGSPRSAAEAACP